MAQEYKIAHYDPGKEPFLDRNGNQWINVLFEGELGTPTKWVMRPDSVGKYKVGDTVYGRIEQVEGKNYQRFYKEQAQPQSFGGGQGQGSKPAYQPNPEQQESIARSVALKAAVDAVGAGNQGQGRQFSVEEHLRVADKFLAWLQGSSDIGPEGEKNYKAKQEIAKSMGGPARVMTRDERDEYNDLRSQSEPDPNDLPPDW